MGTPKGHTRSRSSVASVIECETGCGTAFTRLADLGATQAVLRIGKFVRLCRQLKRIGVPEAPSHRPATALAREAKRGPLDIASTSWPSIWAVSCGSNRFKRILTRQRGIEKKS